MSDTAAYSQAAADGQAAAERCFAELLALLDRTVAQ